MKVAHRDAPVGDAAARIDRTDLSKGLFCFLILKRMKPCDSLIESSLGFVGTGGAEVDAAEFG